MIHLYTGDGKGKTTAAVGLAVRARGQGLAVVFAQFLKGCETGEIRALEDLGVEIVRPRKRYGFWWELGEKDKAELRREHDRILQTVLERCRSERPPDMVVLDEFTYLHQGDMASVPLCEELLDSLGGKTELVITGRNPGELARRADYLTEMTAVKHPFASGLPARKGIEF
ncbi:MAG: cob(I)yrinic acid a,c-diamide adenosyltransferase [Kiritimatiellia bacterium]